MSVLSMGIQEMQLLRVAMPELGLSSCLSPSLLLLSLLTVPALVHIL